MDLRQIFPAVAIIALIVTAGCSGVSGPAWKTSPPPGTTIPVTITKAVPVTVMASLTTVPEPFPEALTLGETFSFGTGRVASNATVYRYWMNDTYQWHNDLDNHYYTEKPRTGYKYLFVFVQIVNNGDTRVWYPPARNILVHYAGGTYRQDTSHFIPDIGRDPYAKPIEVKEVQFFEKLNRDEYVEDFGYSHATTSFFLYPGKSNALDGYIIFVVPASLKPGNTYVEIPFNGQDTGIWKLTG